MLFKDSQRIDFDHTDANSKKIHRNTDGYIDMVTEAFDDCRLITKIKYLEGHVVSEYKTFRRHDV